MASHGRKCVACGSEDLVPGAPYSYKGVAWVRRGHRLESPYGTVAMACLDCGHLNWSLSEQALADLRNARSVEVAGQAAEQLRTRAESDDMLREVRERVSEGSPSLDDRDG